MINRSRNQTEERNVQECVEPSIPFSPRTGHYAGYEWAKQHGGDCSSRSQPFNEGCEEYDDQKADYEECETGKR